MTPRKPPFQFSLASLLLLMMLVCALSALVDYVHQAREVARRTRCANTIRNLSGPIGPGGLDEIMWTSTPPPELLD
jgi:hypothetical protein